MPYPALIQVLVQVRKADWFFPDLNRGKLLGDDWVILICTDEINAGFRKMLADICSLFPAKAIGKIIIKKQNIRFETF